MQAIDRLTKAGAVLFVPLIAVALWSVVDAPFDAIQKAPQKIFYIHVSSAWTTYVLILCMFLTGMGVLLLPEGKQQKALGLARWSSAAAEVALVFLTIVNITGPIWGKPIWGTWWSWDARLTTNFVLWMTLAVYVIVDLNVPRNLRSAKLLSGLAIFAAANVPVVHYSVRWWRTLHPAPVVMQEKVGGGLDPDMVPPLLWTLGAITLLGLVLWSLAARIRTQRDALDYSMMNTVQKRGTR